MWPLGFPTFIMCHRDLVKIIKPSTYGYQIDPFHRDKVDEAIVDTFNEYKTNPP